jgi:signal transduction histidine kinase/FixJ family two-component response regulator
MINVSNREAYMVGWLILAMLPLVPILMGLKFDVKLARGSGVLLLPREWVSKFGFLAVGLTVPMLANLVVDWSPGRAPYRFVSHAPMLLGGLLAGVTLIVIADSESVSDESFVEFLMCVMLMLGHMTRGLCVGYLFQDDASESIKRASAAYFIANAAFYCHRILKHYSYADPNTVAVWTMIEVLPQFYMIVECVKEVYDHEFGHRNIRYKFCLYFAIFGTLIALLTGVLAPPLIIIGIYVHIVIGFVFAMLLHKDENNRVEESLASKRSFVRYIAHEMRTPLNVSIIGLNMAMDQLKKRVTAPPGEIFNFPLLSETLEDSSKAIEEAADTLNEMLTFDKIESGKFEIERERLHIRTIIESVYRSFFLQAQQKELKYIIELPWSLNDVFIMADKKKITQCLRNYISNALKFTPQGGRVTVRAYLLPCRLSTVLKDEFEESGPDTLHIEVVDTGVGIEKNNLKKVFHEVVQFNAAKLQGGGGSGLGMTITKAIMDAHEGSVGVVSEYGIGSTFFLEMVAEVDLSGDIGATSVDDIDLDMNGSTFFQSPDSIDTIFMESDPLSAPMTKIPSQIDVKPKKVLVNRVLLVDDSAINLKMMTKLLQPFVTEILLAINGVEAAAIISSTLLGDESEYVDMVLTDFHMPEMDGLQLTSVIRDAGYSGFIALITGMDTDGSGIMSLFHEKKGNLILTKPIRMGDVTRLLMGCYDSNQRASEHHDRLVNGTKNSSEILFVARSRASSFDR